MPKRACRDERVRGLPRDVPTTSLALGCMRAPSSLSWRAKSAGPQSACVFHDGESERATNALVIFGTTFLHGEQAGVRSLTDDPEQLRDLSRPGPAKDLVLRKK
eukprot:705179-Amphidinium_carterae.1